MKNQLLGALLGVALLPSGCLEDGAVQVGVTVCEEVLCAGYCAVSIDPPGQCFGGCLAAFGGECGEEWTLVTACFDQLESVVLCTPELLEYDACVARVLSGDGGTEDG